MSQSPCVLRTGPCFATFHRRMRRAAKWVALVAFLAAVVCGAQRVLTWHAREACAAVRRAWPAMSTAERLACFTTDVSDNAEGKLVAQRIPWFGPFLDGEAAESSCPDFWGADWLSPLTRYQVFDGPGLGFLAFRWRLTVRGWRIDRIIGYG